jgi:NADH-quinone oxidoreductase subunit N
MLGYSSIAHMGYVCLGLIAHTSLGYAASAFYVIVYACMSLGAFGFLLVLSHRGIEIETFEDLRGLNARNPWLAFMMLIIMFSMAGIPPTGGFFAKIGLLQALINTHLIWLATLAILFAVIGAYYYLNVVKMMYFEEPINPTKFVTTLDARIAISLNGLLLLGLGLFPSSLIQLCQQAF